MTDHERHPEGDEDSGLAAFDIYIPHEAPEDVSVFDVSRRNDPTDGDSIPDLLFTAGNADESVSVSALMNGAIHRVELSPWVSGVTETELAREILNVARVAEAKGRAGQYELVSGLFRLQGQDEMSSRELLVEALGLPTPQEAIAAEAALASRHFRH